MCEGLIILLVIIYKGYSPSLVRVRGQEVLEVVFAGALCHTGLTGEAHRSDRCLCEVQCLTGHHHWSDWWTLLAQVFGKEKFKLVV
jgi:hypothetical protein